MVVVQAPQRREGMSRKVAVLMAAAGIGGCYW